MSKKNKSLPEYIYLSFFFFFFFKFFLWVVINGIRIKVILFKRLFQ
jgi:hypothetical protein